MGLSFDTSAIPKCWDRIGKAERALYLCRNASTMGDFQSAWADLLSQTGSLIHAIEAGSAGTAQGRQWYGGMKRKFRSDPLLQYMFQARNSEEHGIASVTALKPNFPVRQIDEDGNEVDNIDWGSGRVDQEKGFIKYDYIDQKDDRPTRTQIGNFGPPAPVLRPVVDSRNNQTFAPPKEHLGRRITDTSPINVAGLFIVYLIDLTNRAGELI